MITKNAIAKSDYIAENIIMSGKRLLPKPGTAIAGLVATLAGINESGSNDEIVQLSTTTNIGLGSHTDVEDQAAKKIGKIMSTIIVVARNTVNPKIKDILKVIEEHKLSLAEEQIGKLPLVKQVEFDSVFMDDIFTSMIDDYRNTNIVVDYPAYQNIKSTIVDDFTSDEARELMRTGSKGLDDKVTSYLGPIYIENSNYLRWFNSDSDIFSTDIDELLTQFLLLNGLVNGRVERLNYITEDTKARAELIAVKAKLGDRLCKKVDILVKAIKRGDVILPSNVKEYGRDEVLVLGKTYRDWIQNGGGSPEAVMGYGLWLAENNIWNESISEQLKNNPADFATMTTNYQRHMETMRLTKEIENVPKVIHEYLARSILNSDMEPNVKIAMQEKLTAAVQKPYYGDMDLTSYVRDVVCAVFTVGEDVKRLLVDIDNVLNKSEVKDMDYSVLVGICSLIGRWCASQIDVGV